MTSAKKREKRANRREESRKERKEPREESRNKTEAKFLSLCLPLLADTEYYNTGAAIHGVLI